MGIKNRQVGFAVTLSHLLLNSPYLLDGLYEHDGVSNTDFAPAVKGASLGGLALEESS